MRALPTRDPRGGIAMVAVLLVLMALFVMSAPFLQTVRNADQASAESSDRAYLRLTLDAAERHASAKLRSSHPALDETPYHDDLAELEVTADFPEGFLATRDPSQTMWDLDAVDVAGRVDLSSASPHVLANLIGGAARLGGAIGEKDVELTFLGADGFLDEGVVFVDDEVIGFGAVEGAKLLRLQRGLMVEVDPDGNVVDCGPSPARPHDIGAFALDQRAWALAEWRIATGTFRAYEGVEQIRGARDFVLGPELGREAYLALERTTSPWAHVRAGATWQRPARLAGTVAGVPDYGCKLPVDDVRWFNAGTTVMISDGRNTELALVRATEGTTLVLARSLPVSFEPWETLVAPLARVPVNVNTATPEVLEALWTNLKLRGRSARITSGEAKQLVDLALASRPFTGFEDFLRRLVLPAGGLDELPAGAPLVPEVLEELARNATASADGVKSLVGIIDADDARALYKNALNANDNELEFATMPLCFTSRDVYDVALRATVNAPSGIERASGVRELSELIVPQRDLLTVWTRQEDFDEAPRLDGGAAGWMTGPVPTSRFDGRYGFTTSMRWPTRARAHLGAHDSQPSIDPLAAEATFVYSFADRDSDDGWAQLAPWREDAGARGATLGLHFDDESKVLEGRFLPDGTVPLELARLGWTGDAGLMAGMSFEMWIEPQALEEGAHLLDLAGRFTDADRVSLLFEEGDLVLRVFDGAGDHPTSTQVEEATIRYPLAGEGAGLPVDTWSHVRVSVDGNRPDQLGMWVDGRRVEEVSGMTRLTAALSSQGDTLQVESTVGFPDKCTVRIGNELIEVIKTGAKQFKAKFDQQGENAGFGGRLARETFQGNPEVNQGLFKAVDHPSGSTVQLYGYSLPIYSNVPNVEGSLRSDLAMFAVARVTGVSLDGSEREGSAMEPIQRQGNFGPFDIGHGFDAMGDELDGLLLETVDPGRSLEDTMSAFDPNGGYAAILGIGFVEGGNADERATDVNGALIGGVEVVRYSGWEGNLLRIQQRGGAGLARLTGSEVLDPKSFIVSYGTASLGVDAAWRELDNRLPYQVMVIPISVAVRSAGATGFEPANNGSEFAQITHGGGESGLTEWVRYDEITGDGHLVRSDPTALIQAATAAHAGISGGQPPPPPLSQDPRLPGPSGAAVPEPVPSAPRAPRLARSRTQSQQGNSYWFYAMGEAEDQDFPVARAVNSQFQFRGVMGTYCHAHPAGTQVLPVFRTRDFDETAGWPGRFDEVMFLSVDPQEPGFPGVVQHAHKPLEHLAYFWEEGGTLEEPIALEEAEIFSQSGFPLGVIHVALDARLAVPFVSVPIGAEDNPIDNRLFTRMCKFPSGELPRVILDGALGRDVRTGGGVPAAVVDEALFFDNPFGGVAGMPGQLVLARALGENDPSFEVLLDTLRTTRGDVPYDINVLANLPERGGMLRIGEEYLCYDSYTKGPNSVTFTVPDGGRGLLGSDPQPHRPTEGISYLPSIPVGTLVGNLTADDAEIPLLELPPRFPSMGTVWMDGELVHYSRVEGNVLAMPRASTEPGKMDGKGAGILRGRYGTQRAGHQAGTPVVLHPFRYWDGWSDLADAPEMSYLELSLEQPDAYWKSVFWKAEDSGFPGPQLGVLQKTDPDAPWDERPEPEKGLDLLLEGKLDGGGNRIRVQSDRVQWRVFVRHLPGSFDSLQGLAHGWKTTPRLELFGVEYMGPDRTLARIDR